MTIEMKVTATIGSDGGTINLSFEEDYKLIDVMTVLNLTNNTIDEAISRYTIASYEVKGRKLTEQELKEFINTVKVSEMTF